MDNGKEKRAHVSSTTRNNKLNLILILQFIQLVAIGWLVLHALGLL